MNLNPPTEEEYQAKKRSLLSAEQRTDDFLVHLETITNPIETLNELQHERNPQIRLSAAAKLLDTKLKFVHTNNTTPTITYNILNNDAQEQDDEPILDE